MPVSCLVSHMANHWRTWASRRRRRVVFIGRSSFLHFGFTGRRSTVFWFSGLHRRGSLR